MQRFHCIKDSFQGPNVSFIERFHRIKKVPVCPIVPWCITHVTCVYYLSSWETLEHDLACPFPGHMGPGYEEYEQVFGHDPQNDSFSCFPKLLSQ